MPTIISGPITTLKTMVSESSNFQTLVGAGSAAAALAYIDVTTYEYTGSSDRPRCIIWPVQWTWNGPGGQFPTGTESCVLALRLEIDASALGDPDVDFWTTIEDIINDVATLSGGSGYLVITNFDLNTEDDAMRMIDEFATETGTAEQDYFSATFLTTIGNAA